MKSFTTLRAKTRKDIFLFLSVLIFAQIFSTAVFAQKPAAKAPAKSPANTTESAANLPKVSQIDAAALNNLLKRTGENAKPLLVNFWATWCDPCREEFPELVKINAEYAGKIDFVTVSLDDLAEIKRDVPKFLAEMKATMPAYLLKTENEEAAIAVISKDYVGGLPFTILFDGKGASVYFIQGKVKPDILRVEIDKLFQSAIQQNPFEKGKEDAKKDIIKGKLVIKANMRMFRLGGSSPELRLLKMQKLWEQNGIVIDYTSQHEREKVDYMKGYNSVSEVAIRQKYGENILKEIGQKFYVNYAADVTGILLTQK